MSKQLLIDAVANSTGETKKEAARNVDAVLEAIAGIVSAGTRLTLAPLGTFSRKHKAARAGRNPQTGEAIEIAARDVIVFKSSRKEG